MKSALLLLFFSCLTLYKAQPPNPKTDQINIAQAFPSLANENIGNLYSGYIQLSATRILHYWYAEVRSPLQAANVPVIAWFNGGPGCSSMDGALYENGPFYFEAETFSTKPVPNPYSWNTIANVLYIEMPAGVGFSVKNDNYPQDDYTVADDNVLAILQFLTAYNLLDNELYVMGESYAGVYVPYLSKAIVDYNAIQKANNAKTINFQGFSTGNGCTSPLAGECYFVQSPFLSPLGGSQGLFLYEQGFITQTQFITFYEFCYLPENQDEDLCYEYVEYLQNYVGMNYEGTAPYINLYDVYRYCALEITNNTSNQQRIVNEKDLGYKEVEKAKKNRDWKKFCSSPEECDKIDLALAGDKVTPGSPCIDSTAAHTYLNNRSMWSTIGINQQYYSNDFVYTLCVQSQDQMDFTRSFNGSYWIYPEIVALNKYKIMIYSGNTDLCVPIAGTRQWIDQLRREANMGLVESMRNWYYYPDAPATDPNASMPATVAGTVEEYDNHFRFVTVNGVGHMVPMWNRKAALEMVDAYINWKPLPKFSDM